MKKVILLVTVVFTLCGCTNKTDGYEKLAQEQLEKVVMKVAKNPDTYKITDMETAYKQDSICIIRFNGRGENGFGGSSVSRYEFVMLSTLQNTDKQVTLCFLTDLDGKVSVLREYKELNFNLPTPKPTKDDSIYYYCAYKAASYDGSCSYNGVVKELTKNKDILETVNEFGL